MPDPQALYADLRARMREATTLETITAVLEYDDETVMPAAAADYRGEQASLINGLRHDRFTDPKVGELLSELEAADAFEAGSAEAVNVREWRREYDRQVKLPRKLVQEITETSVRARNAWIEARGKNDFPLFKPWLEKTFDLQKQVADALGYEDDPYDALIDQYEIGAKTKDVAEIFKNLRESLVTMIHKIQDAPRQPDMSAIEGNFDIEAQKKFVREVVTTLGFDPDRGAIGIAHHPFCTTLGPNDVRITTRYEEKRFDTAFSSTVHEGGHAMYDQNVRQDEWGNPMGQFLTLGVHESQSRFWENQIGRTRAFWEKWWPVAKGYFPQLANVDMDAFLFAMNAAQPSLIRVDADELTYNLHIMIRFELELAILHGDLSYDDVPAAWNERYQDYLGVEVPSDADGCLQDIHWSLGIIGYFPTYALGNLYAAQFAHALSRDLGPLDDLVRASRYDDIRGWLTTNIHSQGRKYTPKELIEKVTGEAPTSKYLVDYLADRFGTLYGIEL